MLAQVLRPLKNIFTPDDYPDLLVGINNLDDAAVWRLSDNRALVVTTDFFTPVVDDAYEYGAIAAANSLSDVYAMGGKPFLALNMAALPPNMPTEISAEILRGGADKTKEAGVVIAGGHTIQDQEPKYGLIVLGFVDPNMMLTKGGAQPGDKLLLSKPLGFGTTTTAIKQEKASQEDIDEVVYWMMQLNDKAAELGLDAGVRTATDITGFSLIGHAWEIAKASLVGMRLHGDKIPFTKGARRYASDFIFPGGAFDNQSFFQPHVEYRRDLQDEEKLLLFDPQTSGGLLMAVPSDKIESILTRAEEIDQPLWMVGEVIEGDKILIV